MPTPQQQLLSRTLYTTDGVTTVWDFAFASGYLDVSHVRAKTNGDDGIFTEIVVTPGMLVGQFQLQITPALPAGLTLTIYRATPRDAPLVDYTDSASFTEVSMDTSTKQAIFCAAEVMDEVNTSVLGQSGGAAADAAASAAAALASELAAAASALSASNSQASASASQSAAAASAASASANAASSAADAASAAADAASADADAASALDSKVSAAASEANVDADRVAVDAQAVIVASQTAAAISASSAIMLAQAESNALLGLGIGTSYVDANGHLIMTYSGTVSGIAIDSNGHLQLTY